MHAAHGFSLIDEAESSQYGVRLGNPDLCYDVYTHKWRKLKASKIGIERAQDGRARKFSRIAGFSFIQEEAREQSQGTRPQPKGGVQGNRWRLSRPQGQLPDLVVRVVGWSAASIRGEGQAERSRQSQVPIAHGFIL